MNYKNNELYNEEFYAWHEGLQPEYEHLANWIHLNCKFETSLEIGCGNAYISTFWESLGKDVRCSDFSEASVLFISDTLKDKFTRHDITEPFDTTPAELVTCFEVAEHIEPEGSEMLVENITKLAKKYLLFSSEESDNGQPELHCNCRPTQYWIDAICAKGFVLNWDKTNLFRNTMSPYIPHINWFLRNFLFFERPEDNKIKINLGCGTNHLEGWYNHDWDVDITQPLPWANDTADFVFAEHVLEHITQHQAFNFLKECYRILKPGGVLRITIPNKTQVYNGWTEDYGTYSKNLGVADGSKRQSLTTLLFGFGHQSAWTAELLQVYFYMAGFEQFQRQSNGISMHPELMNIEVHNSVVGANINLLESITLEGTK